jgi:hypothetical protein
VFEGITAHVAKRNRPSVAKRDIVRAMEMAQKVWDMALKPTRWDTAETLKEDVAAYLDAVLEDGDPDLLRLAVTSPAPSA